MIKKKYLVAFLLLFCVVVVSSFITYNMNYSLYIEEVKNNLQDMSNTASYQYDSIFSEIYGRAETIQKQLETETMSRDAIMDVLKSTSNNSYYIYDMAILTEDGEYINPLGNEADLNKEHMMAYFERSDQNLNFQLIKSNIKNQNIYYGINYINLKNHGRSLLLVGINYNLINHLLHPDKYNIFDGSLYLLSNDGYFLYHQDEKLVGKNLFADEAYIREQVGLSPTDYNKLARAIGNKSHVKDQYFLSYEAYGTQKIAYYNYLKVLQGVTFLSIDFSRLAKNQMVAILRTIIPLLLSLGIATYILTRYIFLIKYTDYFTEVKNEYAYRKHIRRLARRGQTEESYLIVEIQNVSSNEDREFLYDDRIFYHISSYFKKIATHHNGLYRISRLHYMFVLKDCTDERYLGQLLTKLGDNIQTKGDEPLYIRGRKYFFTLDHMDELDNYEVDSKVLNHMTHNSSDLEDYNDLTFVNYSEIQANINQRLKEKLQLESAILENQFTAHYQPIVDLETNATYSYEVFMRLDGQDPSVSTAQLIQVAEEENMIEKVDRSIIKQAFYQYNKELHKTKRSIRLSINLSAKSINEKMVEYINQMARKCKVIPSHITFEITETAAMDNLNVSIQSLNTLRRKGFKLAIDDFGTGYSHVELLSQLAVDYIKIDGTFILDVEKDEQKLKTLNALVYISKNYNAKIIADFVENDKVIVILKKLGISYGQGCYFGELSDSIEY